jgi:hypothetical protein
LVQLLLQAAAGARQGVTGASQRRRVTSSNKYYGIDTAFAAAVINAALLLPRGNDGIVPSAFDDSLLHQWKGENMSGSHCLHRRTLAFSLSLAAAVLLPGCGGSGASMNAAALAGDTVVSQPAQDFSSSPDTSAATADAATGTAPSAPTVLP